MFVLRPMVATATGASDSPRSTRPRRERWIATMTSAVNDHEREAEEVVVGVARGERRARHLPPVGEDREHEPLRVEQLLDHDAEAERRQRQEEAGEPDRRDGDERADGHGDQCREQERGEPRHAVVDRELRERDGADRGERRVAQRHLARRPHEQPERQDDDRGRQPDGEVPELRRVDERRNRSQRREHDDARQHLQESVGRATAASDAARCWTAAPACVAAVRAGRRRAR